jgi:hypothetical protein
MPFPMQRFTVRGEEPRGDKVDLLEQRFGTEEKMRTNVRQMFADPSRGYICQELEWQNPGFLGYSFAHDVLRSLLWLPADHPVVDEIITQSGLLLRQASEQTADKLKTRTLKDSEYANTPLFTAFAVAGAYGPASLYDDLNGACYHVAELNLRTDSLPPREDPLLFHSAIAMRGYGTSHRGGVVGFYEALRDREIAPTAVVGGLARIRESRAVDAFADLFSIAGGEKIFIHNGVQYEVHFDMLAQDIVKHLSQADILARLALVDESVRGGVENYFFRWGAHDV